MRGRQGERIGDRGRQREGETAILPFIYISTYYDVVLGVLR